MEKILITGNMAAGKSYLADLMASGYKARGMRCRVYDNVSTLGEMIDTLAMAKQIVCPKPDVVIFTMLMLPRGCDREIFDRYIHVNWLPVEEADGNR